MSGGKHTAEPWGVFWQPINGRADATAELALLVKGTENIQGSLPMIVGLDQKCTAVTGCGPKSKENATRIVDCVNALQGIENPAAFREVFDELVGALAIARAMAVAFSIDELGAEAAVANVAEIATTLAKAKELQS